MSDIPTIEDLEETKEYMENINEFVSSTENDFTDRDGQTRLTITGVNEKANAVVGDTTQNTEDIAAIQADYASVLKAASLAVGCELEQIILATDTTTVLDDILYIHDADEQVTYDKPSIIPTGQYLVSVVDHVLATTDLTEYFLTSKSLETEKDFNWLLGKMSNGEEVKIAVYGDSTVDGNNTTDWIKNPRDAEKNPIGNNNHNLTAPNSWPVLLEEYLRDMYNNQDIHVYNAGYSSQAVITQWAEINIDTAIYGNSFYGDVDAVLVSFGLNDSVFNGYTQELMLETYSRLCDIIKNKGSVPVVCTPDIAIEDSARSGKWLERVIQVQKAVAKDKGLEVIDFNKMEGEFYGLNTGLPMRQVQSDDLHFSDKGHILKAGYAAANLFTNTIFIEQDYESRSPWSKFSNITRSYGVTNFEGLSPYGGNIVISAGANASEVMLKTYTWNTKGNAESYWNSITGDGFEGDFVDAPLIVVKDYFNEVEDSNASPTAGQTAQTLTARVGFIPTKAGAVPFGLGKHYFMSAAAYSPTYLGYFEFRSKPLGDSFAVDAYASVGTEITTKKNIGTGVIGGGNGLSFKLNARIALQNNSGLVLWSCNCYYNTTYDRRGLMLYKLNSGSCALFEIYYSTTDNVVSSFTSLSANALLTLDGTAITTISLVTDALGDTTITASSSDAVTSTSYTFSDTEDGVPLGGELAPTFFHESSYAGGVLMFDPIGITYSR